MLSKRLVAGGVAIAAVAAVGTWALLELTDDPDRSVQTVDLGAVRAPAGTTVDGAPAATVPVSAETLAGTVERVGDDVDELAVGTVELDFGPDEWVRSAGPIEDYDGDGDAEDLRDELDGLVGRRVELVVTFDEDDDDERDDADVLSINGLTFAVPSGSGPDATEAEVTRAAEAAVGGGARVVEIERDDEDGTTLWEVEVLDADGREHTVVLNAAGDVLGTEADD